MRLTQSPASQAALLAAFNFWLGPKREIVIAGDLQQDETREILKVIHSRFMPDTVTLFHKGDKSDKAIYKIVPFIEHQTAIDGKATVYVCQNYVCKQPVHTARELEKLLLDSTKK